MGRPERRRIRWRAFAAALVGLAAGSGGERGQLLGSVQDQASLNGQAVAYDAHSELAVLPSLSGDMLVVVGLSEGSPAVVGSVHDGTRLDGAIHATTDGRGHALVAAYNSDALTVVDISEPSAPAISGALVDSERLNGARAVAYDPERQLAVALGYLSGTLVVAGLADPREPGLIGSLSELSGPVAIALDVRGRRAFVALDRADAIAVIDLGSPSAPTQSAELRDARLKSVTAVAYQAGAALAVVCTQPARASSFSLVDVSSPGELRILSSMAGIDSPSGLAYGGNALALVTSRSQGSLHVVNASRPHAPTVVGTLSLPELRGATDVAFDEGGEEGARVV